MLSDATCGVLHLLHVFECQTFTRSIVAHYFNMFWQYEKTYQFNCQNCISIAKEEKENERKLQSWELPDAILIYIISLYVKMVKEQHESQRCNTLKKNRTAIWVVIQHSISTFVIR